MSADSDESLRRALAGERYWPTARYNSRLYHSSFPDSPFAGPASTDDHDIADDPDADDDPADEDEQEGPAMAPDLSMATTATLQDDDPDGGLITPAVSQSQTLPPVAPKEEVADEDDQHEDEDEAGPSTLISQSRDSPPSSTSPSPADPDPRQHTRATIPELLPVLPDGVDASRVWIDPFILRALCSHRVGRYTPRQNLEYMQQWLVGCGRDLGPMRRVWEGQIPTILLDRDERPGPLSPEYIGEVIVHLALHRVRMDEEDTTLAPENMARIHQERSAIGRGNAAFVRIMSRDPPPYLRLFPCCCNPNDHKLHLASRFFTGDVRIRLVDYSSCPHARPNLSTGSPPTSRPNLVPGPSLPPAAPPPDAPARGARQPHRFFQMTNVNIPISDARSTYSIMSDDLDNEFGIEPTFYIHHRKAFLIIDDWKWKRRYPPLSPPRPDPDAPLPPYQGIPPAEDDMGPGMRAARDWLFENLWGAGHPPPSQRDSDGSPSVLSTRVRGRANTTIERRTSSSSSPSTHRRHASNLETSPPLFDMSDEEEGSPELPNPPAAFVRDYAPQDFGIAIRNPGDISRREPVRPPSPPPPPLPGQARRSPFGGRRPRAEEVQDLQDWIEMVDLNR